MKKGFEIQLNWIFILIAGAIILAFFFTLAQKQRALSSEKLSVQLSRDIDTVFSAAIAAKGVAQPLNIPGKGINFECSSSCECNFYIMNKPTTTGDKIIFAPKTLAETAILWAVEWKLPFRVVNFLLLSQPTDKYIFVTDESKESSELRKKVSRAIPAALQTEFVPLQEVAKQKRSGEENVRVIFLGVKPSDGNLGLEKSLQNKAVTGLSVEPKTRKLTFYNWEDSGFTSIEATYSGDAGLYAAMLSTNPLNYFCSTKQALMKLTHIAEIHSTRIKEISKTAKPECAYTTESIETIRQTAEEETTKVFPQFPNLPSIEIVGQQLQKENENLVLQSCPEIY